VNSTEKPGGVRRRHVAEPYVPEQFAFETPDAPQAEAFAPAPAAVPDVAPFAVPSAAPTTVHAQRSVQPTRPIDPPAPPPEIPGQVKGMVRVETGAIPRSQPQAGGRGGMPLPDGDELSLAEVLDGMLQLGASDVHLTIGSPPLVRINGDLERMSGFPDLTPKMAQDTIYAVLTQKQRERFEQELELDFAYSMPGRARFRVNLYRQRESLGAAFRLIPYEIRSLQQLGMPESISRFAALPRGLVLVTGPTGSGKSTTLAALVDQANRTRKGHIMTVEDPIEFLHRHKACMVNQREVGEDTHSFAGALKHVLRQDPDIILVGEMRDLETISVALTAAETGHLVFATLHTQDAAQTIDRVIDVFPPHQQQQVRVQLSGALQGIICQSLCKSKDGSGRVAAVEVLMATPAIRNLIREGKSHQIYSALQAGAQFGMNSLDQHLADLVRTQQISYEQGIEKCHNAQDFARMTGRG
jgi:twitching motility protein PilT